MTPRPLPCVELLREKFSYNPETGDLFSKKTGLPVRALKPVRRGLAYYVVAIRTPEGKQQQFGIHRIIMAMQGHDIHPGILVDHRDLNPLNNRLENLRLATHQQNNRNSESCRHNGGPNLPKGVHRCGKKFRAVLRIDGKLVHLGMFKTIDEAATAFRNAALPIHGEFFRGGVTQDPAPSESNATDIPHSPSVGNTHTEASLSESGSGQPESTHQSGD